MGRVGKESRVFHYERRPWCGFVAAHDLSSDAFRQTNIHHGKEAGCSIDDMFGGEFLSSEHTQNFQIGGEIAHNANLSTIELGMFSILRLRSL